MKQQEEKLLVVKHMFIVLILEMVSGVHLCVKIYQNVHFKHMNFTL